MDCGCRISGPQVIDVGPVAIDFCPLHAAVPELLESCRQTLKRHGTYCRCGYEHCENNRLVGVIQDAIAKATGS